MDGSSSKPDDLLSKFDQDGFLVFRNVIDRAEIDDLNSTLKATYLEGKPKYLANDLINSTPELTKYATDERILTPVKASIGNDIKFLQCSDMHFNHNVYGWHRDSASRDFNGMDWNKAYGRYACVKIIVYLECSNFGLAVVPGSHAFPLTVEDVRQADKENKKVFVGEGEAPDTFGYDAENWNIVVPLMQPGDAIVFDERLFHRGYPLEDITPERRRYLKGLGVAKFTENKGTFCFTYGPDNLQSERFHSYFLYHRKELRYSPLSADFLKVLDAKGMRSKSATQNIFEEVPELKSDLYNRPQKPISKTLEIAEAINPSDMKTYLAKEFEERPRFSASKLSCPACNSFDELDAVEYPDRREWFFQNISLIGCRSCGFSTSATKPYGLDFYYRFSYTDSKGRISDLPPDRLFSDPDALRSIGVARSKRHVKKLETFGSSFDVALDFGCGYGLTLDMVPAKTKFGVEVDDQITSYAKSRGIIVKPSLEDIESNSVDLLLCSHVLEHLHGSDLVPQLNELYRVAKNGAIFLVEVPNAPLLRVNMTKVKHSPHLSFFTRQSLAAFVNKSKWDLIEVEGYGDDRPLSRRPRYKPKNEKDDVRSGALVAILKK